MRALTFNVYDTLHPSVFVGNLLYLQSILVMPFGSNGPLWSLAHEFWYYLAFPILVLMLTKAERLWLRIGSALLLVAWTWFVGRYVAVLGIPWLMGVLLAYLPPVPLRQSWSRRAAILGAWLLVLGCMAMNIGRMALNDARHFPEIRLVIGKSWNLPIADLILSVFVHTADVGDSLLRQGRAAQGLCVALATGCAQLLYALPGAYACAESS